MESRQPYRARILLVDDEKAILYIITQMLDRLGYLVKSCLCATEAIEIIQDDSDGIDLVVSDMDMPDMPGDVFAKAVSAIRPDMPVVICTGHSEILSAKEISAPCVKGILQKPFGIAEMEALLCSVLS